MNQKVPFIPETKDLDLGVERKRWRNFWARSLDVLSGTITALTSTTATITSLAVTTITTTFTCNGAVNGNAVSLGGFRRYVTRGTTATYALDTTDSGRVYIATRTSSTQTYTLPAASVAGLHFTFICGHADGEILINPAGSDTISVFTHSAIGADADTATVAPAGGTGIKNTAATNVVGDNVTLVSDGNAGWFGVGVVTGIWASQ